MNNPLVMSAHQKAANLFGPEFAKEVRQHAERHYESLDRLKRAVTSGNNRKIRDHQNRILKSYASKLVCLVRSLEGKKGLTPEWVQETAGTLNSWQDCGEPIRAKADPKTSGDGWRPICMFGPKRKALQTLCGDIITAKFGGDPSNYLAKGRGADIASDHITDLLEVGYEFFILVDVKEFYRSVQHGSLQAALGLPAAVIKHCVLISPSTPLSISGVLPTTLNPLTVEEAVRQGLPQGSRASTIIAGLLLGPALREITSADRIIVYGDDVAVAACNAWEAKVLTIALSGVLASHPAGPFQLKRCKVHHINDGFDFLKYRHRRDWFTGKIKRRPAAKSYWRFEQKVRGLAALEPNTIMRARVNLYRKGWMRSFSRWCPNSLSRLYLWLTIQNAIKAAKCK